MKSKYVVRDGLGLFTIRQMVKSIAMLYRDKICMQIKRSNKYEKTTYHQLKKQVESLGSILIDMGLKERERVAVVGENRPEWSVAYLGVTSSGNVIVPLDPKIKPEKWRHILDDSECKYIIASGQYIDDVVGLCPKLSKIKKIICMDKRPDLDKVLYMGALLEKGWQLIKNGKSKFEQRSVNLDDLAAILYTSGTTGVSKGVMLTHKNIMSNVDGAYRMIKYGKEDTFLSVLPVHHTFEATAGFLVPLYGGAAITYAKSLKSKDIIEGIKDTNVTILIGVPLLFEKLLEGIRRKVKTRPKTTQTLFKGSLGIVRTVKQITGKNLGDKVFQGLRKKGGLDTIRLMVSGGAALSVDTEVGFNELGLKLIQGYGLTESAPVLTLNPIDHPKPGSIGVSFPQVEVKIFKPNDDGIGEIIARGPNVMQGYYKNPEATSEVLRDGWLHTGDMGKIDKDGYVYITGRAKNLIVSKAGKNIFPEEIEGELLKSLYISEALVVGKYDAKTERESVHAIIYPDYEQVDAYGKRHKNYRMSQQDVYKLIKSEIAKYCGNLAAYKRVKDFEIRQEEFEKTTTRKIKRYLFQTKTETINNNLKKK